MINKADESTSLFGKCCKSKKGTSGKSGDPMPWLAYVGITKFQQRIIMRTNIDFEKDKNTSGMQQLSEAFADSLCNF